MDSMNNMEVSLQSRDWTVLRVSSLWVLPPLLHFNVKAGLPASTRLRRPVRHATITEVCLACPEPTLRFVHRSPRS